MANHDLTGERFGRLVARNPSQRQFHWDCDCDCGTRTTVAKHRLLHGLTRSCGCLRREMTSARTRTHGCAKGDRLYTVWSQARRRCRSPNNQAYAAYGGRGITFCEEWDDYPVFRDWAIANGYDKTLTLDRIDNDRGYSPDNCRWATRKQQARNRRSSLTFEFCGVMASLSEHVETTGVTYGAAQQRIFKLGWPPAEAVSVPVGSGKRRRAP